MFTPLEIPGFRKQRHIEYDVLSAAILSNKYPHSISFLTADLIAIKYYWNSVISMPNVKVPITIDVI